MSTFTFQGPDGKSYDVNAPEGASEGDAYAKFVNFMKQQKPAAPTAKELGARAMEDTPGWQQPLVNLGAGMDTVWQGAKQLFGRGPSDTELKEQRGFKEAAAEGQPGGGLTQFLGEMLPTMAIPAGGVVRGAQALGRGGMTLARMAGLAGEGGGVDALASAMRFGSPASIIDSATMGGAMGALEPVLSTESRAKDVVGGMLGGALLPGAARVAQGVRGGFTQAGAAERAAQEIIDKLGGSKAQEVVDTLHGAPGTPGPLHQPELFPRSTADLAGSTDLGMMERGSRTRNPAGWADFDALANEGKVDALRNATRESDDVAALTGTRDVKTAPLRTQALDAAGKDVFFSSPVVQRLQDIYDQNPPSSNAYKLAKIVENDLSSGITPDKLYETRKMIDRAMSAGGLAMPGSDEAIVRGAGRSAMMLKESIDKALNDASNGRWQKYLDRYSAMSDPVTSAQAQGRIFEGLTSEGAPMIQGASGAVPEITGTRLGKAMEREGTNDFGSTLSDEARGKLDTLLDAIRGSEVLQKNLRKAGTAGGGSNTAMDVANAGMSAALDAKTGGLSKMAGAVWDAFTQPRMRAAMADALQNPQIFVRGIEQQMQRRIPLTASQEAILNAMRGVSAVPPAMLSAPNAQ